jgi:hypothetical protein
VSPATSLLVDLSTAHECEAVDTAKRLTVTVSESALEVSSNGRESQLIHTACLPVLIMEVMVIINADERNQIPCSLAEVVQQKTIA